MPDLLTWHTFIEANASKAVKQYSKQFSGDNEREFPQQMDLKLTFADLIFLNRQRRALEPAELIALDSQVASKFTNTKKDRKSLKKLTVKALKQLEIFSKSYTNIKKMDVGRCEQLAQLTWVVTRPILHKLQNQELSTKKCCPLITEAIRQASAAGASPLHAAPGPAAPSPTAAPTTTQEAEAAAAASPLQDQQAADPDVPSPTAAPTTQGQQAAGHVPSPTEAHTTTQEAAAAASSLQDQQADPDVPSPTAAQTTQGQQAAGPVPSPTGR